MLSMISSLNQAGSATSTKERYCSAQKCTPRGGVVNTAVKVCSSRSKTCMPVPKRSSTSSSTARSQCSTTRSGAPTKA